MWEDRFKASEGYVFGKAPARFLVDHAAYLTPGASALSVADGEGRNSVFMAQKGMAVTALEFAPSAIARAEKLAAEKGVTVDFQTADVLTRDWETDAFDHVVAIFIQFTGPEGRNTIFDGMKQATKPGGLVMLHGYTPEQIAHGTGGPSNPANMYTEPLLQEAFAGWDILECRAYESVLNEGHGHKGRSALIDFIARKPA